MYVFDPKRPIRKDAPLKSGPGRPTVGRCRRRGVIDREHIRRFGTLGTVASLGIRRSLVRPGKPAGPIHEQIVEHVAEASADGAKVVNFAGAGRAVDHPVAVFELQAETDPLMFDQSISASTPTTQRGTIS
jgi:hypothetical protein